MKKTYILMLSKRLRDIPEEQRKGKSRSELVEMAKAQGAQARSNLVKFLEREGLMDQVEKIGEPMAIGTLFLLCSDEVAQKIQEAGVDGIENVVESHERYIRPVNNGPSGPSGP